MKYFSPIFHPHLVFVYLILPRMRAEELPQGHASIGAAIAMHFWGLPITRPKIHFWGLPTPFPRSENVQDVSSVLPLAPEN